MLYVTRLHLSLIHFSFLPLLLSLYRSVLFWFFLLFFNFSSRVDTDNANAHRSLNAKTTNCVRFTVCLVCCFYFCSRTFCFVIVRSYSRFTRLQSTNVWAVPLILYIFICLSLSLSFSCYFCVVCSLVDTIFFVIAFEQFSFFQIWLWNFSFFFG